MNKFKSGRRSLLKGVAVTGAAATMPMAASAALQPILDKIQSLEFPMPDFLSFAGDQVAISSIEGLLSKAVIQEVQDISIESDKANRPAYVRPGATLVRFELADADQFSNEVYQVQHPRLGKIDMLLSVVPDANGKLGLEAVFN